MMEVRMINRGGVRFGHHLFCDNLVSILPVSPVFKPVVGKIAKFSFFAKLHHVVKFCEFSENVFLRISAKCKSTNWSKSRFSVILGMAI